MDVSIAGHHGLITIFVAGGTETCRVGIKYEDLAYTTQNGFAAVGSNNGHNGTTAITMYKNPDVVADFAWRSWVFFSAHSDILQYLTWLPCAWKLLILSSCRLHTITDVGKKLVNLFYNKPYGKSYYLGCSLGGRQGIKAADLFPDDFDGIVAGSPALDFNNLQAWRASFFPITGPITSPNFISKSLWTNLIHSEILKQCDGIDGAVDGIIEDPNLCDFDPEALLCQSGVSTDCLSSVQVQMVKKIFSPLYGEAGNLIYPAMQPGSEIMAVDKLYAGAPFSYSNVS